jgi:ATP-binding cassette subfamily C protein
MFKQVLALPFFAPFPGSERAKLYPMARTTGTASAGMLAGLRELVAEIIAVSPRRAALAVMVLLVLTITEGLSLVLLAPLLEYVTLVEENPLPRLEGWLEGGLGWVGLQATLGSVLLLYVAIAAARAGLQQWRAHLMTSLREDLIYRYRSRLYAAIHAAQWRFLVTRAPSELVYALTSETSRIGPVVTKLGDLVVAVLVSVIYLGMAIRLSPALAGVVLICAAAMAVYVHSALEQARAAGVDGGDAKKRLYRTMGEQVAGLKTSRSYGAIERHASRTEALSRAAHDIWFGVTVAKSRFQQTLEFGSTALLAALVYISTTVLDVSAALLLVLLYIFARLVPRLITIYRMVQSLVTVLPVINELSALERECAAAAEPIVTGREIVLRHAITFDDVSFSYLAREKSHAVAGLRLRIEAGRTTAIVGASGAGKSSIADLLVGLLTPTSGRILIDDEPLAPDTVESWRRQIAYVPQDTFLFEDTVRANLLWARGDSGEAELWEALRRAAADTFVAGLPQGIDTVIGERGVLLSGGERQRLSIARALLRRPSILVLDEATSSLDVEHERRIQRAIETLRQELTLIIITHRLPTIRHADMIHVIEAGRVTQSGTWDELQLQRDGRFRRFVRHLSAVPTQETA